jgi:Gram-negative bacterial TonB protein C-terminal
MRPAKLIAFAVVAGLAVFTSHLSAETLPDRRPAMIGSGPESLVNRIEVNKLFTQGQRDAWVKFECAILADGLAFGSDFFTASPDSRLLKNEVRSRLRHSRFIPAVYNHKRTFAWFSGTVLFVVKDGRPHLRVYAHQDLDIIKSGADFVAPQMIDVPNHFYMDFPKAPTGTVRDDAAGVVRVRHSVDANGKTTNVEVISEPPGSQAGEYLKKALPQVDFLPGYRNGKPAATTYTFTWWFGQTVGW